MTIFFSSDPHFGHYNLVHTFKTKAGAPAREFESTEAMNEIIIAKHNAVVKPSDHFYCLGDVTMDPAKFLKLTGRLNGTKFLIRGNHDSGTLAEYTKYFKDVLSTLEMAGLLFSHIPIAPWSFNRKCNANVHGHTHLSTPFTYRVADPLGPGGFDRSKLYVNLCLERTNYTPMSLEQIQKVVKLANAV